MKTKPKSINISISEIKERLDNCIDLYTDLFCEKQEVYADGWIGDIKGGVNCFSDAFLSFEDIRVDLELDAPKGMIFDWFWDNVDNQLNAINYYSYVKGLRIKDVKLQQENNYIDHNHLEFIYNRIIEVHGENPNYY